MSKCGLGSVMACTGAGTAGGGGEAQAARFLTAQQALWAQVVRERRITRE